MSWLFTYSIDRQTHVTKTASCWDILEVVLNFNEHVHNITALHIQAS